MRGLVSVPPVSRSGQGARRGGRRSTGSRSSLRRHRRVQPGTIRSRQGLGRWACRADFL